jgi:hypothetical protein
MATSFLYPWQLVDSVADAHLHHYMDASCVLKIQLTYMLCMPLVPKQADTKELIMLESSSVTKIAVPFQELNSQIGPIQTMYSSTSYLSNKTRVY